MWKAESGKLKCATKVAIGGFPVAIGCHRAIELDINAGHGVTMQTSFLASLSICSTV
jgi:hypothetical protein